jgi:hypothetical protein
MTPELEKCIVEFVQVILNSADKIKASAEYHIPDLIHQLMVWHSLKSFAMSVIAVVLFVITVVLVRKVFKLLSWPDDIAKDEKEKRTAGAAIRIIVAFVSFITAFPFINLAWLKIWLTPKVWLVEYATNLLGQISK